MNRTSRAVWWITAVAVIGVCAIADAQVTVIDGRVFASNIIVPQRRVIAPREPGAVEMTKVEADVSIVNQVATTTLVIHLQNRTHRRLESELIVPVPEGASVRSFSYQGASGEVSAKLLPADEARRIYESIVAQMRDPALLEFVGYGLVRSSVFPVEPNGTQQVRLTYEHLLKADGNRVDYVLPRTESLEYRVPWHITVKVRSRQPISTVYSPSHRLVKERKNPKIITGHVAKDARTEPGSFRLSYMLEQDGMTASLYAYPEDEGDDGYFLLLMGLPATPLPKDGGQAIKREVTFVFDRSGSMNGEKLRQVREAAFQVLAGLEDGEAFNVIVYNEGVDLFSNEPVIKTEESVEAARAYLKGVKARGGTNIHGALTEALAQKPTQGMLPIVLFLTDGLPTIGETSEVVIREVASKHNPHNRRVFTFGVGVDVNTPLLDKVASETRATATFVLPKEDVEVKVAQVFKRLSGPVLAEPELTVVNAAGNPAPRRTRDMLPMQMPDLFEGDQLVVLGQYVGAKPLNFLLEGNYLGNKRTFKFEFALDKTSKKNAFVPRLWASRKIAFLIDAIREMGGNGRPASSIASDPRLKELVDEVIRLSTEFGILTEYTAFLAREGTDLAEGEVVRGAAMDNFERRAVSVRSGLGAVNQETNMLYFKKAAPSLNFRNNFLDADMNSIEVSGVQQVNDKAFYQRDKQWIDSRIADKEAKADRTIEFGSKAFFDLVRRLAEQNRQGVIAMGGDVLLEIDDEVVLIKGANGR